MSGPVGQHGFKDQVQNLNILSDQWQEFQFFPSSSCTGKACIQDILELVILPARPQLCFFELEYE